MPANHSSMDLLSKSLGQHSGSKGDRLAASKGDNQQGDSFKTVIDRGRQSRQAERADRPEAAPDAGPKNDTTNSREAKLDNPVEPVAADGRENGDSDLQAQDRSTLSQDRDDSREAEDGQQLSLLPTAALAPESGNALPPREDGKLTTPVEVAQIATAVTQPIAEEIARVVAPLPRGTESGERVMDRSGQSLPRNLDLNTANNATLGKTAVATDPASADTNIPGAPAASAANKAQPASLLENGDPIKLTAADVDGTDVLKPEPAVKTPEVKWQSAPQQQAPLNLTTNPQREISATQAEQLILDKAGAALAGEAGAEKPAASLATAESGATMKLSSGSVDQQWLQQLQSMQTLATQGKTNSVQMQLPLNIHNPQWFAAMADRVSWLASQSIQAADIQLDPPELGPLQVRIAVNNDQASVNFISHQATVRDTLDSQLMRLRELFESEGMNLVDVNVSDREQQQQGQDAEGGQGSGANGLLDNNIDNEAPSIIPVNTIRNWVDYYV